MRHSARSNPLIRCAVATVTAVSVGAAVVGCQEAADDPGPDDAGQEQVDDLDEEAAGPDIAYDGPYDEDFVTTLEDFEGKQVTVIGTVGRVISPDAFLIAGAGGLHPLLVVNAEAEERIRKGSAVTVSGVLRTAFDLPEVEDELGRDLDDADLVGFGEAPYITAERVDAER